MTNFISADDQRINYSNGRWAKSSVNGSFITGDQFATVTFDFEGIGITVFGNLNHTGTSHHLRYALDGQDDNSFSLNGTLPSSRTLYSSPTLTPGNHTLALTLIINATALYIDGMFITANLPTSPENNNYVSEIVGGAIGGAVSLLFILLAIFLYCRRKRCNKVPYALGPLQASLPTSKEAFTSRNYSHYGLSFTTSVTSFRGTLTVSTQK